MMDGLVLPPDAGRLVWLGGLGVRYMLGRDQTGGQFSLVEHPLEPGTLGSPMHTHTYEDECSFVLEGRVGMQVGDRVVVAEPGTLVFKPRAVPHAFWNAGEQRARFLELIIPAGFERYFDELAPLIPADGPPDVEAMGALWAKYGLRMDMDSVPRLIQEHNVSLGRPPREPAAGA